MLWYFKEKERGMKRAMTITDQEQEELTAKFYYITNYESDDPTDLIDPITYVAPDGDTCLHYAVRNKDTRAVELLLKGGVDPNARGDLGETALHIAKSKGFEQIIRTLLEHGASTTTPTKYCGCENE